MAVTTLGMDGTRFTLNSRLTYSDIPGTYPDGHGLLMNARFIQGIFDEKADPARFSRFGIEWDPSANTDRLIAALPEWKQFGLLAFTVGLSGGMPVFSFSNDSIDNNPFGADGRRIDPAYLERLDRLITAADRLGMVVIVSLLYEGQSPRLEDGRAVRNAVANAARFLREGRYANVIIEVANEHDINRFRERPLVYYPDGIASLIDLARSESGGLPVGASSGGCTFYPEVCRASDVILLHGNGATRQTYYDMIRDVQALGLKRPILCNEDSPCFSMLKVARRTGTSWGYYNNHTKQEPPCDWGITPGEDRFFALRLAEMLGIETGAEEAVDPYYLQGLEGTHDFQDKLWIRLASLYPETIDYVEFFRNGVLFDVAYEEPFYVRHKTTWIQAGVEQIDGEDQWTAVIHRHDGEVTGRSVIRSARS